jgi:rhodanese-related sulfurtransferase
MHARAPVRCATLRVEDGYQAELAGVPVQVLHTPGHTQDSLTLVLPDRILTGDVLFLDDGGAGRDDLPGGNPEQHWESLQRLLTLPNHLVVYPAHEYRHRQPSTLGEQRERNPHLRPRTRKEYVRYVEDLKLGPAEWMKAVLQANYACARDPGAAWVPVDVPACEVKGTLVTGVNDQQVATIRPAELKARLDAGQAPMLLDVREPAELAGAEGHLAGAHNLPIGALGGRLAELGDRGREIVTICRSGGRAHTAAQILQQAGFCDVRVLDGGMVAWRMAGYPVAAAA